MKHHEFICDYLSALGVRYTREYSQEEFDNMPFMSMFGLCNLLKSYGVESHGVKVSDKSAILDLPLPFVATVNNGDWVIVTGIDDSQVTYMSQGTAETVPEKDFVDAWTGVALLSETSADSCEPDYHSHRFCEVMIKLRDVTIILLTVGILLYFIIAGRLYESWSVAGIVFFDLLGLAASIMLAQKTIGVDTSFSARVCGIIEKEGCDTVLSTAGSTFMGIFHWSEVGLGYFSVSLIALIVYPPSLPFLAMFNICCLPYTLWSVSYQRFKAHAWCTLCLTVQGTLWILFALYMMSGSLKDIGGQVFRSPALYLLPAFYVLAVMAANKIMQLIKKYRNE